MSANGVAMVTSIDGAAIGRCTPVACVGDAVVGVKDVVVGAKDAVVGGKDAVVGAKDAAVGGKDAVVGGTSSVDTNGIPEADEIVSTCATVGRISFDSEAWLGLWRL